MAVHRASAARGRHFLRSRAFAEALVRDAGLPVGGLVLDLGAGSGMLTRALREAGARVRAVELDRKLARELERRWEADEQVEVVAGDLAEVGVPGEPFAVVANLPFATSTAVMRRFLGDPRVPLVQMDVIVEWGLAVKRTHVWPSTLLGVYWGAWYELGLVRRVPRDVFAPPPSVDAALLRAVRRTHALVPEHLARDYEGFLSRAFARGRDVRRLFPPGEVERVAAANGFSPRAAPRDLDAAQWAALYRALRSARSRREGSEPPRRPSSSR